MATSAPLSEKAPEETGNPGQELADKEFNPDRRAAGNPTDPRGNDVASGDSSDPRGELRDKERAAASPEYENQVGTGYRRGQPQKGRLSIRGLTRRRAAGGGIVAAIISLIIGFFFLSGPAEVAQLSQILQKPGYKNSSDSANRVGRLFRYSRTGKVSDTVMARLGIGVFGGTAKQLSDIGVEIETNPLTKRPTRTTFETEKLKAAFPELEGMSDTDAKAFIAEQLSQGKGAAITPDQIKGSGGQFHIDQSDFDLKTTKLFTKNTVSLLDDGKIIGGVKARSLTKFFGIPSLFHPLSRLADDKLNALTAAAKQKAVEQQEKQAEDNLTGGVEAEGESAIKDIRGAKGSIVGALTLTGGACMVYSTAGEIVTVNRDLVVLPAALMALHVIAIGEQVRSGQDLTLDEVGALMSSLNQNGKSVWQGQALDALSKGGADNKSLTDLSPDYKTAFSGDTTASSIQAAAADAIHKGTGGLWYAGGKTGACSTLGTLAQAGAGFLLVAKDVFEEAASGGTLTPEVAAEIGGLLVAKETLSTGETLVLLHYINSFILNQTTAKLGADAFQGPIGGDLLAYGARSAANIAAIASGGIALGNQASTILATQEQQQDERQFKSEGLAQRLFNPYDYRTPVGKLVQSSGGSPIQDLSRMGSLFTHFGSLFTHSVASITPKAAAATAPYNWGFPQYGLSDSLLNDPNLDNPYDNAAQAADLLQGSGGDGYKTKAFNCFGVDISDDNSDKVWDVIPDHEINPSDSKYPSDCNSTDENWKRIEMFVFDTTTMKAVACYQGDDQSCTDLGANASGPGTTQSGAGSAAGTTTSLPTGTAQQLAQQLVPYVNNGKIKCVGFGGDFDCSDITNTAKQVSIKGGLGCQVDALQPALLGMLLELVKMNHTFALSALCSDHHDDGLNGHAGGRAADFNTIDGVFMGPSDSPWTSEKVQAGQKLDQDIASFMPKSTGFGQVQCHPVFDFLSGFSAFNDTCNHQHVQVEN